MENRKTIIFLGSLFLAIIVFGMLYVSFFQQNIEGLEPDDMSKPDDMSNNKPGSYDTSTIDDIANMNMP